MTKVAKKESMAKFIRVHVTPQQLQLISPLLVFLAGGDVASGDKEVAGGLGDEGAGDGLHFPLSGVATAGPGVAMV